MSAGVRIVLFVPLVAWSVWATAALLLGGVGPESVIALRGLALATFAAAVGVAGWRGGARPAGITLAVGCAVITLWFVALAPSHERAWTEDQSRLPSVRFDGDQVHLGDLRAFRYRATDDWDAAWVDRTYDLSTIQGVDFAVEQFGPHEAIAHTLVTFRFADAPPLAVSVEIRKEVGESFGPVRGLFRQYELMYVLGDERDLLELRTVHRRDEVYLYPMRATPAQARALLESLLRGARAVAERPAFYNTVSASCTSVLARHLREVADLPLDHRVYLPGYSDQLAFELGLIATDVDLAATRARFHINERAYAAAGAPDFSARIRALTAPDGLR